MIAEYFALWQGFFEKCNVLAYAYTTVYSIVVL